MKDMRFDMTAPVSPESGDDSKIVTPGAPEFDKYFPKTSRAPSNIQAALDRLIGVKDAIPGYCVIPPKAITDLRFRLVQLHEFMHAFCHRFRDEIRSYLKIELMMTSQEWAVATPVIALVLLGKGEQPPTGYKLFTTRGDHEIGYAKMPTGIAALTTVMAQCEELFVDFLCSAAAGAAYWTTMLDFETSCPASLDQALRSRWTVHQPHLYDPHPPAVVRFILFPQMFLQVFSKTDGLTGVSTVETESLLAGMREHIKLHVLTRMPATNDRTMLTYENMNAPAEVQTICFAFESLIPLYYAVCRCYSSLLERWLEDNHPLSVFRWWFFSSDYHRRIADLSAEFAIGAPRPIPDYFFDSISGAAAARLCYDKNPVLPLDSLEQKATAFQKECQGSIIPLHLES